VRFLASELARLTGGTLHGVDVELDGVSFDSRTLSRGELFVALSGERDGHDHVAHAFEHGASAALVARPVDAPVFVVVDDVLAAFGRLGNGLRTSRLSSAPVVGITGSVGKTSVKDLTVAALGRRRISASPKSFNNDQGLPYTIVNSPDDTDVLVLEMGMRGFGEIARLCSIAEPSIGVVTRVGEAHTARVGGIDGVARAKAELVQALPPTGTAVLNAQDPRVAAMADLTDADVVTFGNGGDVSFSSLRFDAAMCAHGTVVTPWGSADLQLSIPGEHMAINALAALAVAGVVTGEVVTPAQGLAKASVSGQRMDLRRVNDRLLVIDDTYNANPTSMEAALRTLVGLDGGRRVALVGEMAEVDNPEHAHRRIAALAAELDVSLVAVGTSLYGVEPDPDPARTILDLCATTTVVVLVKASRSAGLEWVVAALNEHSVEP
jgi:UDP-N-acetylmuramoyl-tripeptide--D-alanyl-D-alanine ligase